MSAMASTPIDAEAKNAPTPGRLFFLDLSGGRIHYASTMPGIYGIPIAFVAELAISFILMSAVLFALNHEALEPYTHYVAAILIATYIAFESP